VGFCPTVVHAGTPIHASLRFSPAYPHAISSVFTGRSGCGRIPALSDLIPCKAAAVPCTAAPLTWGLHLDYVKALPIFIFSFTCQYVPTHYSVAVRAKPIRSSSIVCHFSSGFGWCFMVHPTPACSQNLFLVHNEQADNSVRCARPPHAAMRLERSTGSCDVSDEARAGAPSFRRLCSSGSAVGRAVANAVGAALSIYILVGVSGYHTFGDQAKADILVEYPDSTGVTLCRVAIVILVAFSYPLQTTPCRQHLIHLLSSAAPGSIGSPTAAPAVFAVVTAALLTSSFLVALNVTSLGLVLAGTYHVYVRMHATPCACMEASQRKRFSLAHARRHVNEMLYLILYEQ
jgi:hypothetical protein